MRLRSERAINFLFPQESDQWLSCLRVGLGLQIVLYCFYFRTDWAFVFAAPAQALISRQLSEAVVAAQSPLIPTLSWLVAAGRWVGFEEGTIISGTWLVLLGTGLLLIVGFLCRPAAVTAWLLHLCAAKSGDLLAYGVDNLMTVGLFYLMWAPLPDAYALDRRIWKQKEQDPAIAGLFRRALQIHLCVIYFFSGLTKSLGLGWWNGDSIWRALTRPPFNIFPPEMVVNSRHLLPALGIVVCAAELGYAVLIWPRRTRKLCLLLICGMHLSIGLTMGMHLFALIMLVLNLAAFGPAPGRKPPALAAPSAAPSPA